jgi:hypothetical protein
VPINAYYDWHDFFFSYIACCFKPAWYNEYFDTLTTVDTDIDRTLDIVTLLRRLRMHGIALSMLTNHTERNLIALRSTNKPIENVKQKGKTLNPNLWAQFESLTTSGKFLVYFLSRYKQLHDAEFNKNKLVGPEHPKRKGARERHFETQSEKDDESLDQNGGGLSPHVPDFTLQRI